MKLPLTLIGYMGSGKSTIGRHVAKNKGLTFIDLDEYIQESTGMSITEIFKQSGEKGFRDIESKCLSEVLLIPDRVIALGGGTPCFNNNIDLIKSLSTSIYLQVTPEELTSRLIRSLNPRPLIEGKSRDELLEFIRLELDKRNEFYLRADYVIQSDRIREEDLLLFVGI